MIIYVGMVNQPGSRLPDEARLTEEDIEKILFTD